MPMTPEDDRDNHIIAQSDGTFAVANVGVLSSLSTYGWIAVHVWVVMVSSIVALSLWPEGIVSDIHHLDKIGHLAAYSALALLPGLFAKSLRQAVTLLLVVCLIGVCLEGAQSLLPDRVPSLLDLAANLTGAFCGTWVGFFARPYLKPHVDQFRA